MTSTAPLERPHVWRPGTTERPLLLLHGTGGDEHDLLPLGDALVPGAALLSPRGTVLENGMPRFFRRLREGVFDEDDLRVRYQGARGVRRRRRRAARRHAGSWYAVGFSNGANIASALLLRHPEVLAGAVLFAAMVPFAEPPDVDLTGKTVILANGRHDPMATADHTRRLVSQLRERGAEVTEGTARRRPRHRPARRGPDRRALGLPAAKTGPRAITSR
jgi:phospholipase/carboxylesterase